MLLLCACIVLAVTCASAQRAADKAPSDADLVASSELYYSESGGFAGRVHEARIVATGGSIAIEYRPRDARPSPPLTGTMPPEAYVKLWRAVDAAGPWQRESVKPPAGAADMILSELRIRVGSRSKTLTWSEGARMPEVQEAGSQILAAAREHTRNR